jgi:hypothetical protein
MIMEERYTICFSGSGIIRSVQAHDQPLGRWLVLPVINWFGAYPFVIAESGVGKLTATTGAALAAVKVATRGWEFRES